jgi:hypothetical protein
MAADVEDAGRSADVAAGRLDGVAESSDQVASKGAQAAGALSGLGDLVGGPWGAAMQGGGVAMQAFADAGDLVNVVTESAIVKKAKDIVVTTAQRAANMASAAATRTAAAAQWLWNAAMTANPIGLVIAAVALLIGGLILLYRRSERFRAIVQAAMRGAQVAIRAVWTVLKAVGGFIAKVLVAQVRAWGIVARAVFNATRAVVTAVIGRVVAIVQGARARITAAWQAVRQAATTVWNAIRETIATIVGRVVEKAADIKRGFTQAWTDIKQAGVTAFETIMTPINKVIGLVKDVLDLISKIKLPDIDVPLLGSGYNPTAGRPVSVTAAPAAPTVININVTAGVGDPLAIARQVDQVLRRRAYYLGTGS